MTEAEARSWAILATAIFTGIASVITAWQVKRKAADVEQKIETVAAKVDLHEQKATERARLRGEMPAAGPTDERQR